MPELLDVLRSRHSIRRFAPAGVPESDLALVLDAMSHAPSAGDLQAYEVVVVRSPGRRAELARAAHDQEFVAEAPLVLVFFMDAARSWATYGERGADLYACQDATIAACHAQLAAHAVGLATVWVGSFDDGAVCRAVRARRGLRPTSLLVVGHAAEAPASTPRRPLDELVHRETFGAA